MRWILAARGAERALWSGTSWEGGTLAADLEAATLAAESPANPSPEMVAAESLGRVVSFVVDDPLPAEVY